MATLKELILEVATRIPDDQVERLFEHTNRAVQTIARRLYFHKSDLIMADMSVTIAAAAQYGALPADFIGLIGRPYISGYTTPLEPIPSDRERIIYTGEAGTPLWYEVLGANIYIYPYVTAGCTLNGRYAARPVAINDMDSVMPFNNFCNEIITEYITASAQMGPTIPAAKRQELDISVNEQVDALVEARMVRAPVWMPGGINWDDYAR